jgi:mannose-6-phosphate isomerase-like protein (cupin superfamily)
MFKIIDSSTPSVWSSGSQDLYQYKVYIGSHKISTDRCHSYWWIKEDLVISQTGSGQDLDTDKVCVEILGYTPEYRSSGFQRGTDLPYINGCSTKQLIPPVRPGDPTFQMLYMPPGTSEQAHHIHATARVVYVLAGRGRSLVGSEGSHVSYDLTPGSVIILGKMTQHHFETDPDSDLTVLPLHIYSSVSSEEFNHPMFNGTHRV